MTGDADGWAGPGTVVPGLLGAAAPHLLHADEWVGEVLRTVVAADGVGWSSAASARYREALTDGAGMLQSARNTLQEAAALAARHDAAVELARQASTRAALAVFWELHSAPSPVASLDLGR